MAISSLTGRRSSNHRSQAHIRSQKFAGRAFRLHGSRFAFCKRNERIRAFKRFSANDGIVWAKDSFFMPEREVIERAREDEREGKAPSTQAGEFIREEFHHIREGKHGARSPQQAIAIGLSKARRSGVRLRPPSGGRYPGKIKRQAERDYERGQRGNITHVSPRRSRVTSAVLKRESRAAGRPQEISKQAHRAAQRRSPSARTAAARRAVQTKGHAALSAAARKAARTRKSRS